MRAKLGRVVAAAGLATLLAPSAAFASWWDGGYQPARREQPPRRQPPPPQPSPGQPPSTQPPPTQPPPTQPPPSEQPAPAQPPSEQPSPAQPAPAQPAPAQPAGPPPGTLPSIYGCENTDLPGTATVLQKSTTPPPGTPVAPGQEIAVDIRWRVTDWVAPELHKALDCVYINNRYSPGLSGGERPTPNDGSFEYSYVVPADVTPGSTICDQGFVSGPNSQEDYGREVSNVVCFPVGPPPQAPPPPAPPASPPPPVETTTTATTAPTTTTTERSETEAERISQQAPPETPAPPASAPKPVAGGQVLPRTGGDPTPGRLAAGALGLAVLLRPGRRRKGRRRS